MAGGGAEASGQEGKVRGLRGVCAPPSIIPMCPFLEVGAMPY